MMRSLFEGAYRIYTKRVKSAKSVSPNRPASTPYPMFPASSAGNLANCRCKGFAYGYASVRQRRHIFSHCGDQINLIRVKCHIYRVFSLPPIVVDVDLGYTLGLLHWHFGDDRQAFDNRRPHGYALQKLVGSLVDGFNPASEHMFVDFPFICQTLGLSDFHLFGSLQILTVRSLDESAVFRNY